ncbi:O-antigen ligase family protein [Desulfitobacterium sp. AusDCA]|uniref:O-antigen ligase family protein n=1 Tax=Desulfitobacterium sp. AusDCA TaxID=3240383 RepID=UPI003DA6E570
MLWVTLVLTLLVIVLGWIYPRFLLPLLILALPLELSSDWFPHLTFLNKLGEFVGVIYFGRIFTLAVIAYYIFRIVWPEEKEWDISQNTRHSLINYIKSPLIVTLSAYLIWGALSILWSVDKTKTMVGVARLGLLWVLGAAVYDLVKRKDGDFWVPITFAAISTGLAGIGAFEMVSKHFIWKSEIYQLSGRINATFLDANIYARFLIIGCLATIILMLGAPLKAKFAGGFALLLQLLALVGTGSRTGWLAMLIVSVALAFLIPKRPVIITVLSGIVLGMAAVLLNPGIFARLLEIKQNFGSALTERSYLITAGVEMFRGHPLWGVGLGGFQKVMLTKYAALIQNNVSLSHTALITTAAELGMIGLGILTAFMAFLYERIPRAFRLQRTAQYQGIIPKMTYRTVFVILAVTAILISAQGEGRFFEDPYLWILVGYGAAIRNFEEVS